ncbi:MAG: pyridoxal-phosphate dependent enzyme, partial [Alicyclobacillus sp.]|nr:pyridoxal-phosphate dependent enzyme [Alicyclobacillus sp.]
EYELTDPRTGKVCGRRNAREVFRAIAAAAWESGDPGLVFLDTINRDNPVPHLGAIEATNPCGETPLLPFESCNLGSINLARMLLGSGAEVRLDWERLDRVVALAVRFLDDILEVNRYPGEPFERAARATRKIGLGVMGFAEVLVRLGIPYDSDMAVQFADRLMRRIARAANRASYELALARGSFPEWARSVFGRHNLPRRHATTTAIAPTGTISIIAGTTHSIEPLFALAYRRRHVLGDETLVEVSPFVREVAERLPITVVNSVNPFRLEGQQTAAFEICDALGRAPDHLCIPVGNAGNISAYWKGFCAYHAAGMVDNRPRMQGFEAEGAAALVRGRPINHPETFATAIRIGRPASWHLATRAVEESGGGVRAVTDDEIRNAYRWIAREGVFAEPASAASVAGLLQLHEQGVIRPGETVVCVLTGNGLKDPDNAIAHSDRTPTVTEASAAAVQDTLERWL